MIEDEAVCDGESACVDALTINIPGFHGRMTTCGTIDDKTVYNDGGDEIFIELSANRKDEFSGFLLFAWCVDPGVESDSNDNGESLRSARSLESHSTTSKSTPSDCITPTRWKRDGHEEDTTNSSDPLLLLVSSNRTRSFSLSQNSIYDRESRGSLNFKTRLIRGRLCIKAGSTS